MEEVKRKPKNSSLIIFTCYIKTCLQTKNHIEALNTYKILKNYNFKPDSITYNTLIKGLIINKAFDPIIDIIFDSLEDVKTFCSYEIYIDAVNALDKNRQKCSFSEKSLEDLVMELNKRRIYVELRSKKNIQENSIFVDRKFKNGENCWNFSNGQNQINGNNYGKFNQKNFSNSRQTQSFTDNFDFLIKGYKNKNRINPKTTPNQKINYNKKSLTDNNSGQKSTDSTNSNINFYQGSFTSNENTYEKNLNKTLNFAEEEVSFAEKFLNKNEHFMNKISEESVILGNHLNKESSMKNSMVFQTIVENTENNPHENVKNESEIAHNLKNEIFSKKNSHLRERSSFFKNFNNFNGTFTKNDFTTKNANLGFIPEKNIIVKESLNTDDNDKENLQDKIQRNSNCNISNKKYLPKFSENSHSFFPKNFINNKGLDSDNYNQLNNLNDNYGEKADYIHNYNYTASNFQNHPGGSINNSRIRNGYNTQNAREIPAQPKKLTRF